MFYAKEREGEGPVVVENIHILYNKLKVGN